MLLVNKLINILKINTQYDKKGIKRGLTFVKRERCVVRRKVYFGRFIY